MKKILTQERLRELLDYNPETGIFTWKTRRRGVHMGPAGCNHGGYILINIDGKKCYAHRLAWLYMTGDWPSAEIDHIDRRRTNNIFTNLREATSAENRHNVEKPRRNQSGFKGVSWNKANRNWIAQIGVARDTKYLGRFSTREAAASAYDWAAVRLYGEFAKTNGDVFFVD